MLSGCFFKVIKPKTIPKTAKATPKKQPAPVKILKGRQFLEQLEDTAKDDPYALAHKFCTIY